MSCALEKYRDPGLDHRQLPRRAAEPNTVRVHSFHAPPVNAKCMLLLAAILLKFHLRSQMNTALQRLLRNLQRRSAATPQGPYRTFPG
jgi:hypothetical protein